MPLLSRAIRGVAPARPSRLGWVALLALGIPVALAGCGGGGDQQRGALDIEMLDNFYKRDLTRVPAGTRVRFSNGGRAVHNAVAANGVWSTPLTIQKEPTVFGVPILASSALQVVFGLYGYLLPFALFAAWAALALWDLARRDDLGRGATVAWVAVVLVVPFLGVIAYHALGRPKIPGWLRATMIGGGLAAYVLILGIGALIGGIV